MKPEYKNSWSPDDHALAAEFEDVSGAWASGKTPTPRTPDELNRKVLKLAHQDVGEDLQKNWLFGYGPQLATAASIFFAVGMLFVISLETQPPDNIQPGVLNPNLNPGQSALQTADRREADLDEMRTNWEKKKYAEMNRQAVGGSWVRVSYEVNAGGGIDSLAVVDSCLWQIGRCVDDNTHHAYAIEKIRQAHSNKPGRHEEVVVIPAP